MGVGFEVRTGDLDDAAGNFNTQGAEAILDARKLFLSKASLKDSAFGNLQQSKQLAGQYQQNLDQVSNDMKNLAHELLTGTAKLALTAALYRATEELNADSAKGIGH